MLNEQLNKTIEEITNYCKELSIKDIENFNIIINTKPNEIKFKFNNIEFEFVDLTKSFVLLNELPENTIEILENFYNHKLFDEFNNYLKCWECQRFIRNIKFNNKDIEISIYVIL